MFIFYNILYIGRMSVFEFVPSLVVTAAWRVYSPPHKETFQILRDCRFKCPVT